MEIDTCVGGVDALLRSCGVKETDTLLIGVSGGPDSVALLHILLRLRVGGLFVAHLNHGIRGEHADADEAFVRELCAQWNVPCMMERADVPALVREQKLTLEEAARGARYEFLWRAKRQCNAQWLLTAHHMDDQAETVLMHLLRGSGLRGLCGMRACTGELLRPMLNLTRADIMSYVAREQLPFHTDETNLQPHTTRNKLRLELMPALRDAYNPSLVAALCGMAELLREDENYLSELADNALRAAQLDTASYSRERLASLAMPIKSRAVREALERAGARALKRTEIERVCGLLTARTGARVFAGGLEARVCYGALVISAPAIIADEFCLPLCYPGQTVTPCGTFFTEYTSAWARGESTFVAFVDADKLPENITVRKRMPGDLFHPLGAPGAKKFKAYLIDKKVPSSDRETPLLAAGNDVLFFPGGTVAHAVRITEQTTRILRVEYKPAQQSNTKGEMA